MLGYSIRSQDFWELIIVVISATFGSMLRIFLASSTCIISRNFSRWCTWICVWKFRWINMPCEKLGTTSCRGFDYVLGVSNYKHICRWFALQYVTKNWILKGYMFCIHYLKADTVSIIYKISILRVPGAQVWNGDFRQQIVHQRSLSYRELTLHHFVVSSTSVRRARVINWKSCAKCCVVVFNMSKFIPNKEHLRTELIFCLHSKKTAA